MDDDRRSRPSGLGDNAGRSVLGRLGQAAGDPHGRRETTLQTSSRRGVFADTAGTPEDGMIWILSIVIGLIGAALIQARERQAREWY
jgi:hypothetical protein